MKSVVKLRFAILGSRSDVKLVIIQLLQKEHNEWCVLLSNMEIFNSQWYRQFRQDQKYTTISSKRSLFNFKAF